MPNPDTKWVQAEKVNSEAWQTQSLDEQTTDEMTTLTTDQMDVTTPATAWTRTP